MYLQGPAGRDLPIFQTTAIKMQGATKVTAYITLVEYPATTLLLYRYYGYLTIGLLEGGYPYP